MTSKKKRPSKRKLKQPKFEIDLEKVFLDRNKTILFLRNDGETQKAVLDAPAIQKFSTVQKLFSASHDLVPVFPGARTPAKQQERWEYFIKRDFIPRLFRYRSCSKYSFSELENSQLWFSDIKSFNDPFEFQFNVSPLDPRSPKQVDFIKNCFHRNFEDVSKIDIDSFVEDGIATLSSENLEQVVNAKPLMDRIKTKGVCCFSAVKDSVLMWSHYADSHEGFVVEYDSRISPFNDSLKVDYSSDLPTFTIDSIEGDMSAFANRVITTKYEDWSYEEEYRLVHKDGFTNHLEDIEPIAIKAIFFGAKCSKRDRDEICRITKHLDIKYLSGRLSNSHFKIEFDEI